MKKKRNETVWFNYYYFRMVTGTNFMVSGITVVTVARIITIFRCNEVLLFIIIIIWLRTYKYSHYIYSVSDSSDFCNVENIKLLLTISYTYLCLVFVVYFFLKLRNYRVFIFRLIFIDIIASETIECIYV